jgi:hypothetical protein
MRGACLAVAETQGVWATDGFRHWRSDRLPHTARAHTSSKGPRRLEATSLGQRPNMQTSGMYSEPNRARQQTPASTADDGAGYRELQDSQTLSHVREAA